MERTNKSTHDEINLSRLLRRLQKTAADPTWLASERNEGAQQLNVVDFVQKVKYARSLLKNIELYDFEPTPMHTKRYQTFRRGLEALDGKVKEFDKWMAPSPKLPQPLLPTIPIPEPTPERDVTTDTSPSPTTDNLLLSPTEPLTSPPPIEALIPPSSSSLSPSSPHTARVSDIHPQFLQNTNALQDELSGQLEQMAAQLLRNARHFNDALVQDKAVVEDAQIKVESNFDVAQRERIRLRDHRGKSGMTTCWVVGAVVAVVVAFVMMVMLIRITGR